MKKIVAICILLLVLTGCIEIYHSDDTGYYLTEYGSIKYSDGNYYKDNKADTISILDNNVFVDYMKIKDGYLRLYEKDGFLCAENYVSNDIYQIGKLDERDIEFRKYKYSNIHLNENYSEYELYYDDDYIMHFDVDSKDCLFSNQYMYYIGDNIYLTLLKYFQSSYGPNADMNINGPDFLGSDLYKIDIENKQVDLIYSTDNTQAIAYGNENVVYYSDDKYNLHKLNKQNGSDSIVYDGKGCKLIIVSYTHNKFYINTDIEDKVIDVEFDGEE